MLELARYEARRRLKGTVYLTVGLTLLAGMYIATFPSLAEGMDLDQFLEQMPEVFLELFNIATMNTIEGFLAAELYSIGWVLLLGLYVAYSGAGLIASDIDRERMDVLLSLPISRARVLGEKFLALLVPIFTVNAVLPVIIYAGTAAIGYPVEPVNLVVVHLLAIPYLLACGAIGLVLSVLTSRSSVAQRGALVAIFGLFLFESVTIIADYEQLGAIAPMRYFDATAVLVEGSYDWAGGAILLGGTALLVGASMLYFGRRDIA
ncbi:ABC transporter permease subunit [Halapricum desulfuricans]|uniref:ABC-type transport system involved in multi-copper enzyme maturation, permease component n=1 Tax=Halapricum desulfuricans TaxID=2841257 RepID=A0A897MVZ8_9EURY|nr:ABC transporter permease subunit [Halapricum desulfuricans]QSG06290.1 ABC-type transport system involved in multi-copper enzyme maturation, permease component [Halapricum desulfuricans]